MNPLDALIQALTQAAGPRGSTFAGRAIPQGAQPSAREVMSRPAQESPDAEGMGGALATALKKLAIPAGSAVTAMAIPGGRFFHGTPKVFQEFDPALSKSSGLVGPGHAYLTNAADVSGEYAKGATHGISPMTDADLTSFLKSKTSPFENLAPNIRPYQVAPHNSLVTNQPLPQQDLDALLNSLSQSLGTPTPGSFQKGGGANRAANVISGVRAQSGGTGQQVFDELVQSLGPDRANQVIKNAGFQSIAYPGGAILGGTPHQAINVLDPSIMQNLFDALAGQTK